MKSEGVSTRTAEHGAPGALGQQSLLDEPRPGEQCWYDVRPGAKGRYRVSTDLRFIIITPLCQDKDHGNTALLGHYEDGKPDAFFSGFVVGDTGLNQQQSAIKSHHFSFQVPTAFKMR